jgi:hypothetical protein
MIWVYHSIEMDSLSSRKPVTLPARNQITLVAEIDTDDLEVAFIKTQSDEINWWENDGVKPLLRVAVEALLWAMSLN